MKGYRQYEPINNQIHTSTNMKLFLNLCVLAQLVVYIKFKTALGLKWDKRRNKSPTKTQPTLYT